MMCKVKEPEITKMKRIANQSNGVLTVERDIKTNIRVLYCQVCYCNVKCESYNTKSLVDQHLKTGQHMAKLNKFKTKQLSQTMFQNTSKDFKSDLCEFWVTCNIPFDRLKNLDSRGFLENMLNLNYRMSQLYSRYI